jgi:Tfp pilus assembly protein PilN
MMDINLLPAQSVRQRYAFSIQVIVAAVLSLLIVVFVMLAFATQERAASDEASAERIQSFVLQAQKQVDLLQKQVATGTTSQVHFDTGLALDVGDFVKSIVDRAPKTANIASLHVDGNQVTLVGTVDSSSDLASFEESLWQLDRFSSVWIPSVTMDKKVHFTMLLRTRNGGDAQ